ncbi:hypothetical protein [Pelagibaculum spongiae]|uniref:Uncharacterized protein n=1 Tax=Pelagibaculum spongiae TaxID=2080658 RepID=A0A2V1GZA2_9GAMM|nr:hypothetical protein [Pelagibaculum spongiae]PVZ71769.1 hypothetical protein DC094_01710 [Pelagibaculum spongiae]
MAFDLYFGSTSESIEHHEEEIFSFVTESHAQLLRIKNDFYRDLSFSNDQCNLIVHELILVKAEISKNKKLFYLGDVLDRLILFFSMAFIGKFNVRSESD